MLRSNLAVLFGTLIFCATNSLSQGQTVIGPGEMLDVTTSTSEDFQIDDGTLSLRDLELSGQISIAGLAKITRPQNPLMDGRGGPFEVSIGPTTVSGNIIGAGNLEIGNFSRDHFFLSGDNSYTGETLITAGNVIATTSTALGSTDVGTTVQGGNLHIQADIDEVFRVEGGSLVFDAGDFSPTIPVTIAGGDVILPGIELNPTPVVLEGPGGSVSLGFDEQAVWTGGSSGAGDLRIVGRGSVDAALTHDGDLIIDGVQLNAVNTYTGRSVFVEDYEINRGDVFGTSLSPLEIERGGRVVVNVLPVGDRGFIVRGGILDIQTVEPTNADVELRPGLDSSIRGIGVFNGAINLMPASALNSTNEPSIRGGTFNGPIRGTTGRLILGASEEIVHL